MTALKFTWTGTIPLPDGTDPRKARADWLTLAEDGGPLDFFGAIDRYAVLQVQVDIKG